MNTEQKPKPKQSGQHIEKEDIVLYLFTFLLIGAVAVFLYSSQQHQIRLIQESYELEVPQELRLSHADSPELSYYKAQIQQTNKIAGHSSRGLISATTIRYIGFLVGITMVFLGAIMIIRGIRNMPTEAEGSFAEQTRFKIASSSPGVLFSFFGMLVIASTIWKAGDVSFSVYPIQNYQFSDTINRTLDVSIDKNKKENDDDFGNILIPKDSIQ